MRELEKLREEQQVDRMAHDFIYDFTPIEDDEAIDELQGVFLYYDYERICVTLFGSVI